MDNLRVLVCQYCGFVAFFFETTTQGQMFPFSVEQTVTRPKGTGTRHDAARCPHCTKFQLTDIGGVEVFDELARGVNVGAKEQA